MLTLRRCSFAAMFAALATVSSPRVARAGDFIFPDGFEFGFQVQTPDIVLAPGEAATRCYYFHAPTSANLGVRRWASAMTPGVHHFILYASYGSDGNPADYQPPGTLTDSPCSFISGTAFAGWVYAAHNAVEDLVVPADDGTGTPLGVQVVAGQPLFLQMYLTNTGEVPLTASVLLKAEALATQATYTKTATYFTYNNGMSIPPGISSVQKTCAVPTGAKFWWLSTRTHHFATTSKIINAGSDVVVSADWQHPAAATFAAPNFLQFAPGGLTYECVYNNDGGNPIHDGDSETTNENCAGIGYFFPATHPALCLGNVGPL